MAIYKNISPKDYDEKFKAIVNLNGKKIVLKQGIKGETYDLVTEGKNKSEVIVKAQIVKSSNVRVKPICPVFDKCGGCDLQHIAYKEQLNMKTSLVQQLFDYVLQTKIKVKSTLGMDHPFNYRNKSQVAFKYQRGKMLSGFYEEDTHNIIDYQNCHLQNLECNKIFSTIKELMIKMRISAYDEDKRTGVIRHVLVKTSSKNEALVVIVTGTDNFPSRNNLVKTLISRHPNVKTIIQNINNRKTSAVMGEKEIVLYGPGFILDTLFDFTFKITSKSFYQINHQQTEKLYQKAIELANIEKSDTVLDAYCGVGTIGIIASKLAKKVIGVELVKDAVDNAIYNAKINNIKNISFFCQDATNFIVNMTRRKEKLDVLIMDPPRSGSTPEFLKSVLALSPRKVVYISCNPYTQVEDLKVLIKDYQIIHIQPVDMFPETSNVENIVLLTHKENC